MCVYVYILYIYIHTHTFFFYKTFVEWGGGILASQHHSSSKF